MTNIISSDIVYSVAERYKVWWFKKIPYSTLHVTEFKSDPMYYEIWEHNKPTTITYETELEAIDGKRAYALMKGLI